MREEITWHRLWLSALALVGIWNALGTGQILGRLGNWMWDNLPEHVHKPLGTCPPCSASVMGLVVYFLSKKLPWLFYILALSGLMKLVSILVLDRERQGISEP